jgi:hypothetical protein
MWTVSTDIGLFTDASGTGIGGVYRDLWFAQELTTTQQSHSIAWRELYAVVVACRTWGAYEGRSVSKLFNNIIYI